MSTGEMVLREQESLRAEVATALTGAQLKFISNTEFVPAGLRGNMPAIMACVATGRALGIADMSALRSIHIIDGKATFSAELMVQLVRKAGHSITFKADGESCTVYGKRGDNGDEGEFTWTLEMSKRAGLLDKKGQAWAKYPEAMLWARAVSQLCLMLFADCFAGASYTPEELVAGDITADELMDEPSAVAAAPPEPLGPEPEAQAEVISQEDETVGVTDEQRADLVELVGRLGEKIPDTNWSQELTKRLAAEYHVKSYTDLTGAQMDELLDWLEAQVPKRKRAS